MTVCEHKTTPTSSLARLGGCEELFLGSSGYELNKSQESFDRCQVLKGMEAPGFE